MSSFRVVHVSVRRLRNIDHAEVELDEGQNLLIGGNGQGKTTVLEALYMLGSTRSFRGSRPAEVMQHGSRESSVRGSVLSRDLRSEIAVTITEQGRIVRVDGKPAEMSTHFGRFPMVAFHPGDLDLVVGGPAVRRRFLDRMLFQAQPGYPTWFREYQRALRSRNELLKRGDGEQEVRAFDRVMAVNGARMAKGRHRLSEMLAVEVARALEELGVEPFGLRLRAGAEPDEEALYRALIDSLATDRRRCRTTVGPHTDDIELTRPTGLARVVASRGEARSLAVSLRLGERRVIARCASIMPVLLLDDVWAELDRERVELVLTMVASEPGQVVVTGTGVSEPVAVRSWRRLEVVAGRVVETRRS